MKMPRMFVAYFSLACALFHRGAEGFRFHNRFPEGPDLKADINIIGTETESVILNCDINVPNGQKVPHIIHWDKKGEQVPVFISYEGYMPHYGPRYKGRVKLLEDKERADKKVGKASIKISQLTEDDAGWYRCRVLFTNRPPASALSNGTLIHMAVFPRPEILRFNVHPPQTVHVHFGETLILNCEADGNPNPVVQWYKGDRMISPIGRFEMTRDRTELVINDVEGSDIGQYSCKAENSKGKISHSFTVSVLTSATIVDPPRNIIVSEMQPLEWKCEAKAQPNNITWQWLKNGAPISTLSMTNRASVSPKGSLIIHPLYSEDSGHYTCTVTNGIGMPQSASAYLNVEYPARVHSVPTVQYLPVGDTGQIACPVEANPPAHKMAWTKNGHIFNPGLMPYKFDLLANGSLAIHKVEKRDEGHYRCQPHNALGSSGPSEYIQVFAVEPPEFHQAPEPDYRVMEGDPLHLPCKIRITSNDLDADDQVYIRWEKVTLKQDSENETTVKIEIQPENEGGLTLKEAKASDSGTYSCIAVNKAAQRRVTTKVTVAPWSPFRAIKEITATSETVIIKVQHRKHGAIVNSSEAADGVQYTIWYRMSHEDPWQVPEAINTRMEDNMTTFTVGNFLPNTTYHLLLAVIKPKGWEGDPVHMQQYTILTNPPEEDPFRVEALQMASNLDGDITMRDTKNGLEYQLVTRDEQQMSLDRVFAVILDRLEQLHQVMVGKPYLVCPQQPVWVAPESQLSKIMTPMDHTRGQNLPETYHPPVDETTTTVDVGNVVELETTSPPTPMTTAMPRNTESTTSPTSSTTSPASSTTMTMTTTTTAPTTSKMPGKSSTTKTVPKRKEKPSPTKHTAHITRATDRIVHVVKKTTTMTPATVVTTTMETTTEEVPKLTELPMVVTMSSPAALEASSVPSVKSIK